MYNMDIWKNMEKKIVSFFEIFLIRFDRLLISDLKCFSDNDFCTLTVIIYRVNLLTAANGASYKRYKESIVVSKIYEFHHISPHQRILFEAT